ncbi:MAG: isoleucine--tRNA ligase [Myxococcota bacterium]|nr:isoleucine--tRNA ligase [Myxococcota bacterium]
MFDKPESNPDFPKLEEDILKIWEERDVFARSIRGEKDFVFYDGPPFATGTPHYGHLLAGTLKDVVPRYWAMRGYRVERRFGWDTHGLPVEMEIEKKLELGGPDEVEAYGIDNYNEACRSIVLRYTDLWKKTVTRLGRWVDFENDYKTMDPQFMESVWWVFQTLWDKGLIYEGYKVMPYSWRLGTPLSNFEANMDYRKVQDPAVTVALPILEEEGLVLLAWTTTPWTLPSNMALCVGPDIDYVRAKRPGDDTTYVVAEALKDKVLGEDAEILSRCKGRDLVGLTYTPLFELFAEARSDGAFRVVADDYVSTDSGTGIVHQAPAFGEDDWRVCEREGIPMRDATDLQGRFLDSFEIGAGQFVKDADKAIISDLKSRNRLFRQETIDHDYPYCWRSGTPLIYKAISTWFVKVSAVREAMVRHNQTTNWVPGYVGEKRFNNWLLDARDWAISRNRFWGTPLPIWRCDSCDHTEVVGSIEALQNKCGEEVADLHKHFVDNYTWTCPQCAGEMKRIPEVLDCWFESGSMPYAQNHYPFENKELVEQNLPADFIAEGLDQTRGWFYTLLVLSTALFDRPAFKNVIVNGLILAEDGRKMSKSLKNYPDPDTVVNKYGADALRAYLVNSPVVRAEPMRFQEQGVREVVRSVVLPLWNAYSFFATYAAVDDWSPPQEPSPVADRALMDRWIISMVQSLVRDVNDEMEGYRLYNVIPRVLGFIDHLTNWYIRRCRRRFWHSDNAEDHEHAFETLYEVLCTFSRLLAPILPFMAELLYQNLEHGKREGASDSVHLEAFPNADESLVDRDLENVMEAMREVVNLGRNLREQHRIRVRQPLPEIKVASSEQLDPTLRDALSEVVQKELNVKAVTWIGDASELVSLSVKANFKVLGRRLGPKMKPVANAIAALAPKEIQALRDGKTLTIEGEEIALEHVLVVQEATGDGAVGTSGPITVELNTEISHTLRLEGLARELVSKIQAARKEAGLEVEDRILLSLKSDSSDMLASIKAHSGMIQSEVLAVELLELPAEHHLVDAGGEAVAIAVAKA